jgi:acyl-CoA synthetase (AMP-forming)/AMP-acid ligase II/acyl carrier protein
MRAFISLLVLFSFFQPAPAKAAGLGAICKPALEFIVDSVSKSDTLRGGIRNLYRFGLSRRYDIQVMDLQTGQDNLDTISERGNQGIIFVFEHPGLIDPVIYYSVFGDRFKPRPLIAESVVDSFGGPAAAAVRITRAVIVPEISKHREKSAKMTDDAIDEVVKGLSAGDNFMIAPSGQIKRGNEEIIGNKSMLASILERAPSARVVLVRAPGVYGSALSTGRTGAYPDAKMALSEATLWNLVTGKPKRPVTIEVKEDFNFPRRGTRKEINEYIEAFYSENPTQNWIVPYNRSEKAYVAPAVVPPNVMAEGIRAEINEASREVDPAIREAVINAIKEKAKLETVTEEMTIDETGLDSLKYVEVTLKIEEALGIEIPYTDTPGTVADLILSAQKSLQAKAAGEVLEKVSAAPIRVDPRWYAARVATRPMKIPTGKTIAEVFLKQAKATPDKVIVSDEVSGAKTYRDLMLGIYAMRPQIQKMKGSRVGIMLPPGVGSTLMFLAVMFSGKTPVMVNYTLKDMLKASVDSAGLTQIITSPLFIEKLAKKGFPVDSIHEKFTMVDDMKMQMTEKEQGLAFARSRFKQFWTAPFSWNLSREAVLLYSSGTENAPKGIPLTHENLLSDVRGVLDRFTLDPSDTMIGFLPHFHSFGITGTVLLPLLAGVPTFFTPDPKDTRTLTQSITAYKPSIMMATPAFAEGIARRGTVEELSSIRIAVLGAQAFEPHQKDLLGQKMPKAVPVEGYGLTETSPVVAVNPPDAPKYGTVGPPIKGVEVIAVDPETMEPVPVGKLGRLLIRGKNVFGGYLKETTDENPFVELEEQVTRQWNRPSTWRGGTRKTRWFATGDLGIIGEDGHITLVDRISRMFKKSGEMIGLGAIESKVAPFFANPAVEGPTLAVEVAGDDMPIVLFTSAKLGMSAQEAVGWIRGKQKELGVDPKKFIDEVRFVDEIPFLGTGKTNYKVLKKILKDEAKTQKTGT